MNIWLTMTDDQEKKEKFVIIYEKYRYLMIKVANDILGDKWLAEDAVQEAFIKIAKNMNKIASIDSDKTKYFLIKITKNTSIDIFRARKIKSKREINIDKIDEIDEGMLLEYYENAYVDNCVLDVLKKLPSKYSGIFLLKYLLGYNNIEIAEIMELSENAVRQRISRGKKLIENSIRNLDMRV